MRHSSARRRASNPRRTRASARSSPARSRRFRLAASPGALSRNRSVGIELGKGRELGEILRATRMVAEGVGSAAATLELARRAGVEMPITEQIHAVLTAGRATRDAIRELMERRLKQE